MDTESFIHSELARSEIYKHLAACYQHPDTGLEDTLKGLEAFLASLSSGACEHASLMRTGPRRLDDLQQLRIEHARLFVGPYQAPAAPYGSIYLEGGRTIMGHSTMNAIDQYRSANLVVSDNFKDAPDHISVELEFMYALILKEIESLGNGDAETFQQQLDLQQNFLRHHLAMWVPPFAEAVDTHAAMDFYRQLATATRVFITEELAALGEGLQSEATAEV